MSNINHAQYLRPLVDQNVVVYNYSGILEMSQNTVQDWCSFDWLPALQPHDAELCYPGSSEMLSHSACRPGEL